MILLVDAGNTRIKWRMADAQGVEEHAHPLAWERLAATWRIQRAPEEIAIGSVAKDALNDQLAGVVRDLWPGVQVIWLRSRAACCGVRIQYAEPERFGVDRFAALVGARALLGARPLVVVDVGTALTVDVLDDTGLHRGGWIMPGVRLMAASLGAGAAQLAQVEWSETKISSAPQHASVPAVLAGVRCMAQGGVRQALHRAARVLGAQPEIVICGGDGAVVFEALVEYTPHSRETLVLDGLAIMAEQGG